MLYFDFQATRLTDLIVVGNLEEINLFLQTKILPGGRDFISTGFRQRVCGDSR